MLSVRRRGTAIAYAPAAIASVLLIVFVVHNGANFTSDSLLLVKGSRAVADCIAEGQFERCDQRGGVAKNAVGPWGLLQYLATIALTKSGLSDLDSVRALGLLSASAFAGLALMLALVGRRTERPWAPSLLVLSVLAGPLVWYGSSAFGEMLAAFLIAAFAVAALLRSHPATLISLLWLAGITKETAPPLLAAIGAIALWATPIASRRERTWHWLALAGGTVLAAATNMAFNWFRWASLENLIYTQDAYRLPDLILRSKFFVSLWSAPNGGMFEFWPVATVLLAATVAIGLVGLLRRRKEVRAWLPAVGVAGVLALHTGILASWWSPFGWVRMGSAADAATHTGAGGPSGGLARPADRSRVLHEPSAMTNLFTVDERCPRLTGEADIDLHYTCTMHLAWSRHSVLVDAYSGTTKELGPVYAVVFATAWIGLIFAAARPPRRDRGFDATPSGTGGS